MLAMRRENDQIFSNANSSTAIATNANESTDGCCNGFQQGKIEFNFINCM